MDNPVSDIELTRNQLVGANFKKLMIRKKTSKYRIMKDTGVSYQTLCAWQSGRQRPSDASTILVGTYLGLIGVDSVRLIELRDRLKSLQSEIDRISNPV